MQVLTEGTYLGDIVKFESGVEKLFSREDVTILSGQDLALGAVIGKITKVIPTTGTKKAGNTGAGATGANAASVAGGAKTQIGTYTLTCITAASSDPVAAAVFGVKAPDGSALPNATVAVPYVNEQINFTLAEGGGAGAAAFVAGDVITIPVTAGSGKVKEVDFDAVDGSQDAYGILIDGVDTTGTLKSIAFTSGGTYEIQPGDQITGATGGATARVVSLSLASGGWSGGNAAGTLILDDVVGTFEGENLNVGTSLNVATIGGDASAYYPDRDGVAVVRDAVIDSRYLVWPTGATATNKAAALAQLAAKGIIVRDAA